MQAEAEKQHSWKINIHAKAKNFHFRFKATNISPTRKIHRLSVLLKTRRFLLTLNSESSASNAIARQQYQGKLIPKFLRLFEKIRFKRTKNQHPEAKFPFNRLQRFSYKEPICVGSLFLGILAFLFSPPVFKGITIYTLVMLLSVAFLFNKCKTGKPSKLLILLILIGVALVCPPSMFYLSYCLKYDKGYALNYVWKAWNIVASLIWNSL